MLRFACVFALLTQPVFATDADRLDAACSLSLRQVQESEIVAMDLLAIFSRIAVERGIDDPDATAILAANDRLREFNAVALRDIRRVCLP